MMAIDERPTIGERYSSATETSNLKLTNGRRGDADLIIAAGLSGGLGIRLWRLVDEFEKLDTSIKVTQATEDPKVRRALVYLDLPTLYETKFEMLDHALDCAAKWNYQIAEDDIRTLVGRCIECFLDNVCKTCKGTTVTGLYGGPQPKCRACKGTGERSGSVGKSDSERAFARELLREMDALLSNAEREIRLNRRAVDEAKQWIEEQTKP